MYKRLKDGSYGTVVTIEDSNATDAIAVIPSDSADLSKGITKGLYLGGTGNVKVTLASGVVIELKGLASGVIHPISVKRVHSTGTTAVEIVGFY